MGPTETDLELADKIGREIVALGRGRVRRIVMIGSRAHGTVGPESDLDLVVLIELPPGSRPWTGSDFARSGLELESALGPRGVRIDIRVRTTDRFAEAKDVPGGVEWVAAHGQFVLFETRSVYPPVVRTTPDNVRRELVSSWMHHAASAIESFDNLQLPRPADAIASTAIARLIAAVLTHRGVAPQLDRNLRQYMFQIPTCADPIRPTLESAIDQIAVDPRVSAIDAGRAVLEYLRQDPQQGHVLRRVGDRLSKIALLDR